MNVRRFRATSRIVLLGALLAASLLNACLSFNRPPVPSFSRTPSSGDAPLAVFFDATGSIDPDGTIVEFAWGFGDGAAAGAETATHVYSDVGVFEATLTVRDDRGGTANLTRAISVFDPTDLPMTGAEVGQRAPDFTLLSLDGTDVTLSNCRGFVVLLDFWRSTCPPCRTTMPLLESLRAEFANEGLVLVGVNLDASEAEARAYIEANNFDEFMILRGTLDEAQAVRDLYGVEGIPHTFVIDRQGIVRYADHPIRLRDRHIEPWL